MSAMRRLLARVAALFRRGNLDADLDEELAAHIELAVEDNLKQGMSPEEARRRALVSLGGRDAARELHRDSRGVPVLETILQDLRYTFRTLRRDTGLAIFAILIIGLGVGASTTVFSVVNAVLLRSLPFDDPDRLVWISNIGDDGVSEWQIQVNHYLDLREQNNSFSDLAAYDAFSQDQVLIRDNEPERLSTASVSENFLSFLGVQPILGRLFTPQECLFNGPRAVLLSYRLWQRRFAADPAVVGQTITLNETSVVIVGVLPESFDFGAVFKPATHVDLFVPFPLSEETNRKGDTLAVVGRLKPGVAIESARAELVALGQNLMRDFPARNTIRPKLVPLEERVSGRFRSALLILACAIGVVMLIVCANLSNLQLARMARRRKEMAVRVALGARRGRLIRQVLTESVLLSCCGAVVGLLLALMGTQEISSRFDAFNIPLLETVRVDATAFFFTSLIAVSAGIVFGSIPALQVPAVAVHDDLKDSNRGSSQGKEHAWTRDVLVVSEIAFACVLLVGAGLLIRSFLGVLDVNLGFQPEKLAALRIDPKPGFDPVERNAYFDEALRRTRSIPGVREAALGEILPLDGNRAWHVAGKGQTYARGEYPLGFVRVVSEGYFGSMGVPLRAGRDFTNRDSLTMEPVIILNQKLADTLWPGEDPIGKEVMVGPGRRVVGIVGNVRHQSLEEGYTGEMYIPIRQTNNYSAVNLIVRTDLQLTALASSVRAALRPIAPNVPLNEWRTLQQLVDKAVSPRRFIVLLLAGFAGFALILASLGIYAVISYSVNQRTQEIGIRMALGASAASLQKQVLTQTLKLAVASLAIGLAASWGLGRAMQGLLFEVTSSDPVTFVAALGILLAVALLAGYLPARRASRIDPLTALRAE